MEDLQKGKNKSIICPSYHTPCNSPKYLKGQKILIELQTLDLKISPIVPWLYLLGIKELVILIVSLGFLKMANA